MGICSSMYNSISNNNYVCGASMTKIYNRETKDYFEQKEAGNLGLRFLYNTILGRLILKLLVGPGISKLSGKSLNELYEEISNRQIVLQHMLNHNIRSVDEVNNILEMYYENPNRILNRIMGR